MMYIQLGWFSPMFGMPNQVDNTRISTTNTTIKDIFQEFLRQSNTLITIPKNGQVDYLQDSHASSEWKN